MMQESGIPYNVPHSKDPNNAVVRIPIEINCHTGNTEEIPRGRNKYKQHYYDRFNDTFPKNKSGRRKKHYNVMFSFTLNLILYTTIHTQLKLCIVTWK